MTFAGSWALSRAGIADMLRFYQLRASELTLHELVACWACLPEDSATRREASELAVSIDQQLTAMLIDQVRALSAGLGGKRLKKSDQLASKLTKAEMQKAIDEQTRREQLLEMARRDKDAWKQNQTIA